MSPNINSMRFKRLTVILLSGVIIILLAVIGVLVWKYQQVKGDDASTKNQETSARIIQKVSSLYLVPTNEEPTVALIQDKQKLGNQDFFKKAKNGDYLLIYQKDKIALVYREENNKLVNVGPVNLDSNNQEQPTQQGQTAGEQTEAGNDAP